jgi:hypothetical protein
MRTGFCCVATYVFLCGSSREEDARDINEAKNLLISPVKLRQHGNEKHKRYILSKVDLGAGADVERVGRSLGRVDSAALP